MSHLGIDSFHVVGFSDGGEVALLLAIQQPKAVGSALIWGAAGGLDATVADMIPMMHEIIDNPPEFMKGFSEHLKGRYGEDNARVMSQSAAKAWLAILEAGGDISGSRAAEIRCRLLIIAGENDPFVPASLVRPLSERIPKGELVQVPGGGHSLHEEQPEWFIETLLSWLARQPALQV